MRRNITAFFLMQQIDNAGSSSSSSGAPAAKTSGQQHQVCINQTQSASSVASKAATSAVVSVASLVTASTPVTGKAAVSGIKLHLCLAFIKLELSISSLGVYSVKRSM